MLESLLGEERVTTPPESALQGPQEPTASTITSQAT